MVESSPRDSVDTRFAGGQEEVGRINGGKIYTFLILLEIGVCLFGRRSRVG